MPWNGLGVYSPPAASFPEVNGTVIDANRYNPTLTDIAAGISAALAKNGENTPSANLPMAGFKHTGAGDGAAAGQYLAYAQTTAAYVGGSFGVGVTPSTKHHVFGTGNTVSLVESQNNSAEAGHRYKGKNSTAGAVQFDVGVNVQTDNAYEVYDSQNSQLVDRYIVGASGYRATYVNGLEKTRVTSTGLGVGGTPATLLHVSGASPELRVEATSGAPLLAFKDTTTVNRPSIGGIGDTLVLQTGGLSRLTVNPAGAVTVAANGVLLADGGSLAAPSYAFSSASGTGLFLPAAGSVAMVSGGSEIARWNATGLGVLKTPTVALDVNGTVAATLFSGSGANLTALNATNVSTGTLANARTTGTAAATASTLMLRDANADAALRALTLGNTAVAGNVLDWYEEGTFTPTVVGAGAPTYTDQTGKFTRIGNKVKFEISLAWTGGTNGASITFGGLPYSSAAGVNTAVSISLNNINSSFSWTGTMTAYVGASGTAVLPQANASGASASSLLNPNAGTKDVYISGEYLV